MIDEVMELKNKYIELKKTKLNSQRQIAKWKKAWEKKLRQQQLQLEIKKSKLQNNLEKRKEEGFTNQQDWKNHIKLVILKEDNDQLTQFIEEGEQQLQRFEEQVDNLTIDITDAYWTMKITHEYNTHKDELK